MGDNLTGSGEGDDEQIMVDLTQVPSDIERIAFTVTIYDADVRRQISDRYPTHLSVSWMMQPEKN